jgi:multidrug efflux system outer membrane protein
MIRSLRLCRTLLLVALAGGWIAGCSLTPSVPAPEAERTLPDRYAAPTDTLLPDAARDTSAAAFQAWWTAYGDTTLNVLVDSALSANRDLRASRARLEELAAQFRIARAPLFPSATASGNLQYQNTPANTGIGGALGGGGAGGEGGGNGEGAPSQPALDRIEFTNYTASLGLSYELDLWGRLRSQRSAALNQFFASAADVRATRLAVVSQTLSAYFEIDEFETQVRLTQENVDLLRERLELTEDRYARGLVGSFELYTVRQQFEQARAAQPDRTRQLNDAQTRLAVLLGRFASAELTQQEAPRAVAPVLAPIPAGLPSDLLMQRPDVQAAASRLEATRQQIGAARARLLPSLSLTADGGTQSSDLASLVDIDQRFANFAASLTAPLFQGGARRAEVDAARARYRQQVATYEQTLLVAFREVQAALVAYQEQQRSYRRVLQQEEAARASLENQRRRYERGIGDYLALVDAEQNLVQVLQRRATAKRAVMTARLTLYRALGGGWTDVPPPDDPRLFQ